MILYNVSNKVERSTEQEWLDFMKNTHIPEVMATGHFTGYRICRLLDQPDDDDPTYVIQYECASLHKLNHYQLHNAPALREDLNKRFKDKYVAFRTVMEVL
jgi:hypothetical protein